MSCQVLAACLSKTRGWRSDKMLAGPGENAVFRATGKAGRKNAGKCVRANAFLFLIFFVSVLCVLPSGCLCIFSFVFLVLCFPFAPVKSVRNEDVLYENGIVRHRGCPFCGILPADAGTLAQGIGTFSLGCWDTVADMTGHFSVFIRHLFPFSGLLKGVCLCIR